MSKEYLKKLDEEDLKLCGELAAGLEEVVAGEKLSLDKLLGFRLSKTKCFVPPVPCGQTMAPIMSLVPMYEVVLLPIYSQYSQKSNEKKNIETDSEFRMLHGLTPNELVMLSEKGRVIPYFKSPYERYDEKVIKPLLKSGIPKISPAQMALVREAQIVRMKKEDKWAGMRDLASQDIQKLGFSKKEGCIDCLSACYMMGLRNYFHGSEYAGVGAACFVSYALSIQVFDSVLQTECPTAKDILSFIGGLPQGVAVEYILEGLKVNYSHNIPLEHYVDIFDGKTSKALRRIVANLLSDPLSRKYSQRLSAKVYDLNREVNELAEGRAAKVFEAVSDMALYGGKKFIESQTHQSVKIPEKGLVKLGEWLASKGVDFQAKTQRKDWSIAQLYKARCKLKRCK